MQDAGHPPLHHPHAPLVIPAPPNRHSRGDGNPSPRPRIPPPPVCRTPPPPPFIIPTPPRHPGPSQSSFPWRREPIPPAPHPASASMQDAGHSPLHHPHAPLVIPAPPNRHSRGDGNPSPRPRIPPPPVCRTPAIPPFIIPTPPSSSRPLPIVIPVATGTHPPGPASRLRQYAGRRPFPPSSSPRPPRHPGPSQSSFPWRREPIPPAPHPGSASMQDAGHPGPSQSSFPWRREPIPRGPASRAPPVCRTPAIPAPPNRHSRGDGNPSPRPRIPRTASMQDTGHPGPSQSSFPWRREPIPPAPHTGSASMQDAAPPPLHHPHAPLVIPAPPNRHSRGDGNPSPGPHPSPAAQRRLSPGGAVLETTGKRRKKPRSTT